MINRYVVYSSETAKEENMQSEAEFEQLETAMDFVEFYRRKYPDRRFVIRGISYNRSGVKIGGEVSRWEPTPEHLREASVQELFAWLLPDPE